MGARFMLAVTVMIEFLYERIKALVATDKRCGMI